MIDTSKHRKVAGHVMLDTLQAILLASHTDTQMNFPTNKEFVLDELANAAVEYVGGNPPALKYRERWDTLALFEEQLWEWFQAQFTKKDKKLAPKVRDAVWGLVQPTTVQPTVGRSHETTDLYYFVGPATDLLFDIYRDEISMSHSRVMHIQKKVMPHFSSEERRDIEGIGRLMRNYIEEDLKYIRKVKTGF